MLCEYIMWDVKNNWDHNHQFTFSSVLSSTSTMTHKFIGSRSHSNSLVTTPLPMTGTPSTTTFSFTDSSSYSSRLITTAATKAPSPPTSTTTSRCHRWADFRVWWSISGLISCWCWLVRFRVSQREDVVRQWTHYVLQGSSTWYR